MTERRVASLDFLRGVAALSVTIPHFFIFKNIGDMLAESISILGVEVFFVLSGYVLAPQIMFFVIERPSLHNLGVFLTRRWMRTVPPYLIAMAMMSISAHELFTGDFFRYAVYLQNFYHQSNAADYFSTAWSLSVEEWFYLLFPPFLMAIVAVAARKSVGSAVIAALIFILLISVFRQGLGNYLQWGAEVRRVVVFRMDAIAWGFLLNLVVTRAKMIDRITQTHAMAAFGVMLTVTLALTTIIAESTGNYVIESLFPFYASAFGASAIVLALKLRRFVQDNLVLRAAGEYLGRISYSVYLFHLLVLETLGSTLGWLPWPVLLLIYLSATIAIASLMFLAIEAPILSARPVFASAPH